MNKLALCLLSLLCISGCKVTVIAPQGGAVATGDMAFICMPGERCDISVNNFDVNMKLYAVPAPGYRFVHWKKGEHHICPGFEELSCNIRTDNVDRENEELQQMLATDHVFLLQPVFALDDTPPSLDSLLFDGQIFD